MDTIFALATAQGRAGVAVIRVSGPQAHQAAVLLCGSVPDAGRFAVRPVNDAHGQLLDRALLLSFRAPRSFTGEDVIEFHLHGSIAVVQAVMTRLSELEDLRLAEPGEFTRRALQNGKMDLAQVEGLADLIDAETEYQRVQAMDTVEGALSNAVEAWRKDLIRAASLIEVTIDFADEDVPVDVSPEVIELLENVEEQLALEIERSFVAERVRSGFEVAIVGAPNVGKSSLLNYLSGKEAAIVSEIAGTTRDIIEVRMDLGGLPVTFLDTAGIRETEDVVEAAGVSRAIERAQKADMRIFLAEEIEDSGLPMMDDDILLSPKVDVYPSPNGISGRTGEGVDLLTKKVKEVLEKRVAKAGLMSRERHRQALKTSKVGLARALELVAQGEDMFDLAAEELRSSIRSLEILVGRIDVENLLDEIFSSFCLGK